MKNIYSSAHKIVFLMITVAVIVMTYQGKIDAKDFFGLSMVVFYHYYNKNANNNLPQAENQHLG